MRSSEKYWYIVFLYFLIPSVIVAQQEEVLHRIILVGDAGKLVEGKSIVSDAIAAHIKPGDKHATIVFLGDNIYPKGFPSREDNDYEKSIEILSKQLLPFKDYKAKVYMMPGNHDWQKSGPLGWGRVKRESDWVNRLREDNIIFFPKNGCPGPEEVILSDSLVLVIMDTQWWLHPYEKPGVWDDCPCKTEKEVITKLKRIAYRNRGRHIVFASHHPMRSNGVHGGYYTWKQHLFPFTDLYRNAYIPLPILGSIYPIVRGELGNVQDIRHPEYKNMVKHIEEAMSAAPNVLYAAGHDHTLQLIREEERAYIVSGSGSNRQRVNKTKDSPFVSEQRGYVEVEYYGDGKEKIIFHEVNEQLRDTVVFTTVLPRKQLPAGIIEENEERYAKDSIIIAIAPEYDQVGRLHRLWLGENYRALWATPVSFPIFDIRKEKFTITGQGGGMQTKSLRLEDSNGKEWVLRSVQKDPAETLPEKLRQTVARTIVQDQISAAQPYGPLTVPVLSEAIGVPHACPRLVFVPNDTALGFYRKDFANTVCLLEEREATSTEKILNKLREDRHENQIDEKAVLKARVLDLLIGDWDRHEDQWRWQKRMESGKNIYSPLPRDRDQVYFTNSGVLPWIASRKWLYPKFQGFKKKVRDVNGFMYGARYFDRFFLHELNEQDWIEIATTVQKSLTDSILQEAVNQLPPIIYAQCGEEMVSRLKARRNMLTVYSLKYYKFLSKIVEVPTSDENELFEIVVSDKKDVLVKVYNIKKNGSKGELIYERRFNKKETRELRLYGLHGEDAFHITGQGRSPIKLRIIGGEGVDSFFINKEIHSRSRIILYDRSDKPNVYPQRTKAIAHTSEKSMINEYNGRTFKYNQLLPQGFIKYNRDDGVWLNVGAQYTTHGFRKEPYAQRHRIMIGHALATNANHIRYSGHIVRFIGNNDLKINFDAKAPDNVLNFFGPGNETEFIQQGEKPITYYRTRYNVTTAQVKLEHTFSKTFKVYGGFTGQYYSIDSLENEGRFITLYNTMNPGERVYDTKWFGGLIGGFQVDTRNSEIMPIRGIYWNTDYTGWLELDEHHRRPNRLESAMSLYTSFSRDPRLVIINRIGGGINTGDPYFYQLSYLGGSSNLRGFRNYRFAGSGKIYHNLELRFKLFDFTSYLLPGSVGVIGFNDIGRVWAKNETSHVWHDGYGGGFYIMPAHMLLIDLTVGFSNEGILPYISIGVEL
jgi:hypothetical protein